MPWYKDQPECALDENGHFINDFGDRTDIMCKWILKGWTNGFMEFHYELVCGKF